MTGKSRNAASASGFVSNHEWSIGLHLAQQFVERHRHSYIPPRLTVSGFPLGLWATSQRKLFRSGSLTPARKSLIDKSLEWDWCFSDRDWEPGLYRLLDFAASTGHTHVPTDHAATDGYLLGDWLSRQRLRHKRGNLSAPRASCLEQLPGWAWNPLDARWNAHYELLSRFAGAHGHVDVPKGHTVGGVNLHAWCSNQKFLFKQYGADRRNKLLSLPGWSDNPSSADRWDSGYARLVSFAAEHGHTNVDLGHVCSDGYELGAWVTAQRRAYRGKRLIATRVAQLSQVSGWEWTPSHTLWVDGYEHLVQYAEALGTADPSEDFVCPDGYGLGTWTTQQRILYRKGRLPSEMVSKLESLTGWGWSKADARWESGLLRLVEFVEEHGRLPRQIYVCDDGFRLGTWVDTQRKFYRVGKIAEDRRKRLEAWPWWKWEARPPRGSRQTS